MNDRRKHERCISGERLLVYDCRTRQPLGEVGNLSDEGAMLITPGPVKPLTTFRCRLELPRPIREHSEIFFIAECRWCRKNIRANRWETGFRLMLTPQYAELISLLVLSFKVADLSEANPPDVEAVDLENRRRSVRFAFEPPLDIFEKLSYRQIGQLADLSIDGFRMLSDRAVVADRTFACRIKLPRPIFGQDFILLEARCRWCRKNDDSGGYESGHSIVAVSRQDAAVILRLLIHDGRSMRTRPRLQVVKQHAK